MLTTNTYNHKEELVKREKLITFGEWIILNDLIPGTLICLRANADGGPAYESFYVGDCTPYTQPQLGVGTLGWDENHPRMSQYVSEVHLPRFTSHPKHEVLNAAE